MKTLITILLIISSTLAWSQNNTSDNNGDNSRTLFIFGNSALEIAETDKGFHKEYVIKLSEDNSGVTPQSFILNNTETIYFSNRFTETYETFTKQTDFEIASLKKKTKNELQLESHRLYTMFRLYEANESFDPQPVAGMLIMEGEVTVQKLDHELDNTIHFQTKGWFKKLKRSSSIEIDRITLDTRKDNSDTGSNLDTLKTYLYRIKTNKKLKDQFRRGRYLESNETLTNINFSVYTKENFKLFKNRNDVRNRIENLLITNAINIDQDSLLLLLDSMQNHQTAARMTKAEIKNINKEIAVVQEELSKIESIEEAIDKASASLLSFEMESDLVTSLNRLSIKQSTYQNFIELSKSTKTIDLVVYFKSFQKLVDGVAKKKTELETQLDNLTMKIKELETVFANTDDEVTKLQKIRKEEEKNRLDNKIELADELHETMQTIFNARKKYLVDLKSWGRGPEEIASVKLTLTKNIKEKRIIKATQEAKLEKENNILEDYCARYFDNSRKRIIQQIEIEDLQIEFNDGKIENLVVMGSVKASTGGCDERKFKRLEFTNVIPFGFTSKKELEQLNKRWIYTDGEDGEFYKMNVGKLFRNYVEKLEVDRRDYSPRNQVITLKRNGKEFNENENKYSVVLKKEYTHEILGGAIFTDFAGLSGDEPNGIIQTEVYKELPIVTDRILFGVKTRKAINDFNLGIKRKYVRANMGLLAYMRPLFVISKIENEKKVLPLDSKEVTYNGETEKIYFASTLDLRKHETFRVGFDMNVALFDFPELKSTIYLDYGLYWGRTKVGEVKPEGENREYGVDVFEHGPRLVWEVFTDERYGFRLGFNYNWYYARTNDFQQVGDPDMYSQTNLVEDQSQRPNQYWSTEILAFLKPNKDGRGKFFFRYRLNVKSKYWNQTWSQMQLGYAFSITKTTAPKIND